MSIVWKHIIRNIKEKKLRSLLIVLSIALSFMILVLNLQVSQTVEETAKEFSKRSTGWSDITLAVGDKSDFLYFSAQDIVLNNVNITKKLELLNVSGKTELKTKGFIRTNNFGLDFGEAEKFGFINLEKGNSDGAIISSKTQKEQGLLIGDTFNYLLNGNSITTEISGIASCEGVFFEELGSITVIEDIAKINEYLGLQNKINTVYIGTEQIDEVSVF